MEFLINDLSMHGQFHHLSSFRDAVVRVMEMRLVIRQYGYSLSCHRALSNAQVTPNEVMQQAVGVLSREERRAWMSWLTTHGPHWEDHRLHNENDWLQIGTDDNSPIVTDSAVGEAAVCCFQGLARELVSFQPSSWLQNPLAVKWMRDDDSREVIPVPNHWELDSVLHTLKAKPQHLASWTDLEIRSRAQCSRQTFSEDAFVHLAGYPFAPGAAERIQVILNTLDHFKSCFGCDGSLNDEGHRIRQDHFTGDKAWFSDSSDNEKNVFKTELTFHHPENDGETLFCTWHGKIKTPQYRIHFSWPITAETPLYVVYVGPKITKR